MIEIRTPAEFCLIGVDPSYPLSGEYVLMNDLDFTGIDFQPIGSINNYFYGIIHGNKRTLSNITINKPTTYNVGIISTLGTYDVYYGLVEDLSIEDSSITGLGRVGGLCSFLFGASVRNICIKNSTVERKLVSGVSVYYNTGGLVGHHLSGSIRNCYSTADITIPVGGLGVSQVGRLVGSSTTGIISSYYLKEVGQPDNNKGTPKTDAEMKQQATFVGWDFEKTWGIDEGVDYPYLETKAALFRQDFKVFSQETVEYGYDL